MADVITGNTQLAPTKEAVIAAIVQKELLHQASLSSFVTDVSQFAAKGAKSISFPKLTSFTVVNRASGAAGDASVLTAAVDTLNLNFNAYIAWIIDAMDEIQTKIESKMVFAQRAAGAHGRYVDAQILATALAGAGYVVDTGTLRDRIIDSRAQLRKNSADLNQSVIVCSPEMEAEMLKVDEFTRADIYGSSNVPMGMIGRVYGVPVHTHNGLTGTQILMWEKAGLALGFQKAPGYSAQPANEYGTSAVREAMDQLFGVCALEIDKGNAAPALGKSGLIIDLTEAP